MILRSSLNKLIYSFLNKKNYALNDEKKWNRYVIEWEKIPKNKNLSYLGNEWKGEEIFLNLLNKYSDKNIDALEIGCGGGRITATAISLFKHVYATDISKEMLRKCKESITTNNISFHKTDGFTLKDFQNSSVDFVYSHDVFVHF